MQERRETTRRRTFLGGVLAFQNRSATLDCIVRNLGDAGARIAVDGAAILPDEFDLVITRNDRAYRAKLVWRNAEAAGLALKSADTSAIVPLNWARKMRLREKQNAELRRRVSDLTSDA